MKAFIIAMPSPTSDPHLDGALVTPLPLIPATDEPVPEGQLTPPPDDPDMGLPLAVVFPGSDSVLIVGRSRKCLLDSIPLETSGNRSVYSLHHASEVLEKAGWTRLGEWRLTPPPTPEIRRLGIPPTCHRGTREPDAVAALNGQLVRAEGFEPPTAGV